MNSKILLLVSTLLALSWGQEPEVSEPAAKTSVDLGNCASIATESEFG